MSKKYYIFKVELTHNLDLVTFWRCDSNNYEIHARSYYLNNDCDTFDRLMATVDKMAHTDYMTDDGLVWEV